MKTRKCFNDSLQLSELGLGTASIGNLHKTITNQQAYQVISHAYDNGIRYFDTASEYGHGLAEHRLGNVLRELPRDTFIISTKVGDLLLPNKENYETYSKFIDHLPFNIRYDYTYDGIMRCLEDSLQRLGMNRVDIVYVHDLDPIVHDKELFQKYFKDFMESGYKALDQLRKSGAIKAIGLGVKSSKVCKDSLKYCDFQCFMLQGNYTILEHNALHDLFPECQKRGININLAGPFASGVLVTGSKGGYFHHKLAPKHILKKVLLIENVCKKYNVNLPSVAIQFPLKHSIISSVVFGTGSIDYVKNNLAFYNQVIPDELWQDLKDIGLIHSNSPV